MTGRYELGTVVFSKWRIERKIGEGSFGTVYEIRREDFGQVYCAALKVITVPQNEAELKNIRQEGMNDESIHGYFYGVVEDIVREFALMSHLKGMTNVVSCEDYEVIPHDNGMGWDILIRMELLTPLLEYASTILSAAGTSFSWVLTCVKRWSCAKGTTLFTGT